MAGFEHGAAWTGAAGAFPLRLVSSFMAADLPTYLIKITKTNCRIPPVSASTPPPALHTISLQIETRAEETEGLLRQFCAPPFSSRTLEAVAQPASCHPRHLVTLPLTDLPTPTI